MAMCVIETGTVWRAEVYDCRYVSFARETWGVYECHYSCEDCDPNTSCKEGMTCYNDYLFVEFLVDVLVLDLKVDVNRIHVTGLSNGAQALLDH